MHGSRPLSVCVLVGAVVLLTSISLRGQDTPLDPTDQFPRVGVEVGFSSVWQSGVYTARCGEFVEGSRINPLFALAYDKPLGGGFRFEGLLGWQGRGVSSRYNSTENVVLQTDNGPGRAVVDFENIGTANVSYLFILPSMKFYVTRGLYAGAGLSANFLLSATTQYTKNILSKTVVIQDLGLSEVYYPEGESSDPYSKVFEAEDRPDASGFGLDGALYVGAEIRVARKIKIGPRILYTIPFTTVFSSPDLKQNTLQFLIGLRYDI